MIKLSINGYDTQIEFTTFPGGEEHVQLLGKFPIDPKVFVLDVRLDSSAEVMRLLLLRNAIEARFGNEIQLLLNMPYLPYARQDRVCSNGEALSLKVFCQLINAQKFHKVSIADCHSDVGVALLDRCVNTPQYLAFATCRATHNLLSRADVLIIPDLGAAKKAKELAQAYNLRTVQCIKTRVDRNTLVVKPIGKIPEGLMIVADDICDGGGTFLALADAFSKDRDIDLVVTHGIFSKGKEALLSKYGTVEAVYDWTK
jgi:ribose-phosphate pyrophosphokinase